MLGASFWLWDIETRAVWGLVVLLAKNMGHPGDVRGRQALEQTLLALSFGPLLQGEHVQRTLSFVNLHHPMVHLQQVYVGHIQPS